MNNYLKALAAGLFALAASQSVSASTQVRIGVYSGAPVQYHSQPVHVHPVYGPPPGYYAAPHGYAQPGWHSRHDRRARYEARLRRQEWLRREEWRRAQWRREQWRHEHRHDHRGWDDRR